MAVPRSVQELNALHVRYIDLSGQFKSAWTYQQFLQGLQRAFVEESLKTSTADFQGIYGALKEVSHGLTANEAERVEPRLQEIGRQLAEVIDALVAEDAKISPSLLRQFFQRVKTHDDKILIQMVRFYLYAQRGSAWAADPLDKVDFLVTKLVEEESAADAAAERPKVREVLHAFWQLAGGEAPAESELERVQRSVEGLQHEVQAVASLDELAERELVHRYRELKHGIGLLFFHPDVLFTVVDANLAFRNAIRQLYEHEERSIFADYQVIADLEREVPLDLQLDQDLARFHRELEDFEARVQEDNVRLDQISRLRRHVRHLIPRLKREAGEEVEGFGLPARQAPPPSREEGNLELAERDGQLDADYRLILRTLEGSDLAATPKAVTLSREAFPLRLDPREVVAYRRLSQKEECDVERERLILAGAALRRRIGRETGEFQKLLDDTKASLDSPLRGAARDTIRLAASFLHRYQGARDQAVLEGDLAEAQGLQVLEMRLMKEYASLWLLAARTS